MRHHVGTETPLTARQHGAVEPGEKPLQSLIQSPPRSEGKVCFNFAEVLKQTMDLDCALGKHNPGGNSPFSASTIRLEFTSPPRGNAGTSMQFLKSKPADISSNYVVLVMRCWGIFLLSKAHFISDILRALCLAARPALARLRARGTGRTDTSMVMAVCLALTSVDHGELTV